MEGFGELSTKEKNCKSEDNSGTIGKQFDIEKWWRDPSFKKTIKNLKLALVVTLGNLIILLTKLYLNHVKDQMNKNRIFCQPPSFYFMLKEHEYLLFPAFIVIAISTSIILIRIIKEEYQYMTFRKARLQAAKKYSEKPVNFDKSMQVV